MRVSRDCSNAKVTLVMLASAAVSDELWFQPTKGSVCGMCLKISLPAGTASPACTANTSETATCPGLGTHSYSSVSQPWAWNAKIYPADVNNTLPYFIAVIIEWFDRSGTLCQYCQFQQETNKLLHMRNSLLPACRNQTIPYEVTYPTQNVSTDDFGTWPIIYEGIDCPIGNYTLQYHILNVSTDVRPELPVICCAFRCDLRSNGDIA